MLQQRKISVFFLCKHNRFFALDVNGAHSAPTSEKQSPWWPRSTALRLSPAQQPSRAPPWLILAHQPPTPARPPHNPAPLLMEPGPGAPHSSPPVPQSSLPVSQAGLEAMQSGSAVTQACCCCGSGHTGSSAHLHRISASPTTAVPPWHQVLFVRKSVCLSGLSGLPSTKDFSGWLVVVHLSISRLIARLLINHLNHYNEHLIAYIA